MTDGEDDASLDDVVDAGSAQGVEQAKKRSKHRRERVWELWRALLSDPAGREQIWEELSELGTFENRYGVGPNGFPSEHQTFFNLGQRDYGLRKYRTLLVIDGESVLKMHRENDPAFKRGK